jgi:hypothetical protein
MQSKQLRSFPLVDSPGANVITLFYPWLTARRNKLECLSLSYFFRPLALPMTSMKKPDGDKHSSLFSPSATEKKALKRWHQTKWFYSGRSRGLN